MDLIREPRIKNQDKRSKKEDRRIRIYVKTAVVINRDEISYTLTGEGIAKENLRHIFDRCFTTKVPGKETRLGLAIAQRIISEYGGSIKCELQMGIGKEFIINLPVN